MKFTTTHYIIIGVIVLVVSYVIYKKRTDFFTRTCITGDTSAAFVRSPVDYAFQDITEIPSKVGMVFPHFLGKPNDNLQPLETSHGINFTPDELKLDDGTLFTQYDNNYPGCGNGKPYIVNDNMTRDQLTRVGDMTARRIMDAQITPLHVKANVYPVYPEQDAIQPDGYARQYGPGFVHDELRVSLRP